ncbi:type IV pilin [Colwellia sp. 75C3]|uniref:pilus assembly FimT family protein n=1 Tax=Colwellia sp. 75C3 TaxID=888425 RepID=UPI000C34CEB4|nr:prepilin-type N-terminal cleavage/methylation domain-containing protein [Colwellia sp. 75C3]PKG80679.1 type IV pilin [Colwellia sp. 75C3]
MTQLSYRDNGFTLIELVVVMVILGILAVTAAPKFISLAHDSRASTLESIGGAMASGLQLIHSRAIIDNEQTGKGLIQIAGVDIPLYNGYPSVRGRDSFPVQNAQVKAWLDIDAVDRNTAFRNRDAAPFFTDKSSFNNYIYIFFITDYDQKSKIKCHIRYENPLVKPESAPKNPVITIETDDC